jgi:spore maturation protein CgeB
VHVPRRPYAARLPGIPTIRPFEALACGIPLVSGPWRDCEGLFRRGEDHLVARDGDEMCAHLEQIVARPELARSMAESGRRRVLSRHTCSHRADELLAIALRLQRERGIARARPARSVQPPGET